MLTASGLSITFGARLIFDDVTITLDPGRRVALVGGNGVGKTTLLECIVGRRQPDGGTVTQPNDMTVGYLPQEGIESTGGTVLDHVLAGAGEVADVHVELERLHRQLERIDDPDHDVTVAAYGEAQSRFQQLGGYALESEAQRILAGLGFAPDDGHRRIGEMSGGWRMRAGLARLLVARPDLLVLDEPTNHLDVDSVAWLERQLVDSTNALLFVSHDRDFIDAVATHIIELSGATATTYVGGFAEFVAEREERLEQLRSAVATQARQIAQTERFVDRFRYKATKARQVQSRIKALEKLDRLEVPTDDEVRARFRFPTPPRSPRVLAELDGVTVGYGQQPVLTGVNVVVERGQRLALVGPNGAGKTTLLRLLLGDLAADAGTVRLGSGVRVARFDQHQAEALNEQRTVVEEFKVGLPPTFAKNMRTYLGSFGFPGDTADQRVGDLSGGERTRLALGRIMVEPANLLVLDEPTNHLDLASCDVLEDALRAYPGTVLLVTHDRYLIREVATDLVVVRNGRADFHHGVDERLLAPPDPSGGPTRRPPKQSGDDRPRAVKTERKRQEADARNSQHRSTKELRKALLAAERKWEAAEATVADLQRRLADPDLYGDAGKVKAITAEHTVAKDAAERAMAAYERATSALDRAGGRR